MSILEPEQLYKGYRRSFTEKLIPIIKQGLSFKVEGQPGIGKSKYLRFLATSPTIKSDYFTDIAVKFIYIDLNLLYKNESDQLLQIICNELEVKEHTTQALENKVTDLLKTYKYIYIILDHSEILLESEESTIRYIRAIRDQFKYKLGIILGCSDSLKFNSDKFKYINEITSLTFTIGPLDSTEIKQNILHFANQQNIKFSEQELDMLAKATRGYPKYIRQILTEIMMGKSLSEAVKVTEEVITVQDHGGIDAMLEAAMKNLTKSEFMVFKELYLAHGHVVTRDQLASILNPDTEGEGVSNESIDQIVSRVRKALKSGNININIKTKRGIGYYV